MIGNVPYHRNMSESRNRHPVAPAPSRSSRSIDVDGASIYVEEHGDGPGIILIHGGLSTSADWAPLIPGLRDGLRVVTPDSRGHGRSTNPAGRLSYAAIADDIAAVIAALGLHRPVVAGWSDGGQVTLELGVRHPDAASALIVGAAYPDFDAHGLRERHRELLGADGTGTPNLAYLDAELGAFAQEMRDRHAGGEQRWSALVHQSAGMWLGYEGLRPEQLRAIRTPVLVLAGDRDELIPLDLSVALYRALPVAELAVCPSLGHEGPSPERAAVLTALIRDFAGRHQQP